MADDGKSIVLITHKLDEVLAAADRVTVMRNGRVVGTTSIVETNATELARLMFGRDLALSSGGPWSSPAIRCSERSDCQWRGRIDQKSA